jgi:hypothetical protein
VRPPPDSVRRTLELPLSSGPTRFCFGRAAILLLVANKGFTPWVHRVVLSEDRDDGDLNYLTGRFRTRFENGRGGGHYDGPSNLGLQEALAWARERSSLILVQLDSEEWYSAGSEPAPGLPTLPADIQPTRRLSAFSASDGSRR